jgi:hypothetical protein
MNKATNKRASAPTVMSVQQAEATLAEFERQRSDLIAQHEQRTALRREVSFAAHAGDPEASRQLDGLHDEAVRHESRLVSITDAINEARRRLQQAHDAEARAADRDQAKELRVVLDQFTRTAAELDRVLADVARLGHALHQIQVQMAQLGSPVPNGAQLDSLGYRCLLTACSATPWHRHFQVLAPHERRSFSDLIAIWTDTNRKHLASRLEQTNETEAA